MNGTQDRHDHAVQELKGHLVGEVIEAGHPRYDEARRVWNGMIDVRPRAVIEAAAVADIDPVISCAQHTGLPLAVRGGGHSVAGHSTVEAGLVLDLGGLRTVAVDPDTGRVQVAPGARLVDVDAATVAHGWAVPLGTVGATGVAGLALGGGIGWLTRPWGLTLDNLVAAEIVTGTREHLHLDARHNPDLFWGIRGGGGNFGVVSSFTFQAHRLPSRVLGGNLVYGRPKWRTALQAFARWTMGLPEQMSAAATFVLPPPQMGGGGDTVLIIGLVWIGEDYQQGLGLVERLRADAAPDEEEVGPVEWTQWQTQLDELAPRGSRSYSRNASFSCFDDAVIEVLLEAASQVSWYGTGIDIHHMDGFFARVPEGTTAFPNRCAKYWLDVYGFWSDPDQDGRLTAFARHTTAAVEPFAEHGQYVNFLGADHQHSPGEAARRAYGQDKYHRLAQLKARYDPANLFRCNHNILPAVI